MARRDCGPQQVPVKCVPFRIQSVGTMKFILWSSTPFVQLVGTPKGPLDIKRRFRWGGRKVPIFSLLRDVPSARLYERSTFTVVTMGDRSDPVATVFPNRQESFFEPLGRPRRSTAVFHRGPFTPQNGTISTKDSRIGGNGLTLLCSSRGQRERGVLGARQPQLQATSRARCYGGDRIEGDIPRARLWNGAHALADHIWFL
jgi:hypothetical protein